MSDYYDMDGNPITMIQWAALLESDPANRIIASDQRGDVHISTVWLGLDHNYAATGPPLIFETMIFGGAYDQYTDRYPTREQAVKGHAKALALASEVPA